MKQRQALDQRLALQLIKQFGHERVFDVALPGWEGIENVAEELRKNDCVVERFGDRLSIEYGQTRLAA